MIYTVTLNPSIDYIVSVDDFRSGSVNRSRKEIINPGGKGINVSLVLKNLGYDSIALGYVAGFTGDELCLRLKNFGISMDFIHVKHGYSRINVKIRSDQESEINGQGPLIDKSEVEELFNLLDRLTDNDILILGGSVPASLTDTIYMDIMERLDGKNIKIIVDATKDLLVNVLKYNPFLIKPNSYELGDIFGVTLENKDEVIIYAKKLKQMGAQNVLVSMGGDGAVLVTHNEGIYYADAPKGEVRNSVGAGDSMVAGFLAGYIDTQDYKEALKWGILTGSVSAFSENFATREDVLKLNQNYKINYEKYF